MTNTASTLHHQEKKSEFFAEQLTCNCITCLFNRSLLQFGLDTHSLSLLSFPDTPAPASGENLPALVFINPVDPSIPVSSNTLPSRGKLKTSGKSRGGGDLKSHFSVKSREGLRGSKSAESVDKIGHGSDDTLEHDITLKVLPQSAAIKSKAEVDTDAISKLAGDTLNQSGGNYGFFLKKDKEIGSPFNKSSTYSDAGDNPKTTEMVSNMNEVTSMDILAVESSSITKSPESSLSNNPVISAPDKSHYDVPKKLIEQVKSRKKLEAEASHSNKQTADFKEKYGSAFEETNKNTPDQSDGKTRKDDGLPRTNTYVNVTIHKNVESSTPVVKMQGEGIYDVPRSVLAFSTTSNSPVKGKDGLPPTKPKVAPRPPTTKATSVIADYSCKTDYDTTAIKSVSLNTKPLASNISDNMEITKATNTEAVKGAEVMVQSTDKNSSPESRGIKTMPLTQKDRTGNECVTASKDHSMETIEKEGTQGNVLPLGKPQVLPKPKNTSGKASSERPHKPPVAKRKLKTAS